MPSGAGTLALTFSVEEREVEVAVAPPPREDDATNGNLDLLKGGGQGRYMGDGASSGGRGGEEGRGGQEKGSPALAAAQAADFDRKMRVVEVALVPGGATRPVTDANKDEYVALCLRHKLRRGQGRQG